jgi:WD40 repeat protein
LDLMSGSILRQIKMDGEVISLAFSPDRSTLGAMDSSNKLKLWDIKSGIKTLKLT